MAFKGLRRGRRCDLAGAFEAVVSDMLVKATLGDEADLF